MIDPGGKTSWGALSVGFGAHVTPPRLVDDISPENHEPMPQQTEPEEEVVDLSAILEKGCRGGGGARGRLFAGLEKKGGF
jgi:hypothetical protein